MLVLLASLALAASPPEPVKDARVWVGAGFGGVMGADVAPGGGGGVGVEVGARLGKEPRKSLALAARARESLVSGPVRNVGNVAVVVQYPTGTGLHATLGFSHNHEALLADYLEHPVEVTAGIHDTLTHRTGFEAGVGWDFAPPFPRNRVTAGLRPTAAVNALVFPDRGGPHVYVAAELGVRFGLDPLFGG